MNIEEQVTSNSLWIAILTIELGLYRAGNHEQRWNSVGVGIEAALPIYDDILITIERCPWPESLQSQARDLSDRIRGYKQLLAAREVTIASAQRTRLLDAFEELRHGVRYWPAVRVSQRPRSEAARDFVTPTM